MRLALHSVSYAGVWPGQVRLGLEPILDKARAFGYQGVMLVAKRPHASVLDLDAGARRDLRSAIEDRGLELAVHGRLHRLRAGHDRPDVPLREMQVLYVHGAGAPGARPGGRPGPDLHRRSRAPAWRYDTLWGWCVETIRECARRAADYGVTVGVQNHHDVAAHYQSLADLLRDVDHPNARACFDAWAPALHGANGAALEAAAREMAPRTAYTTVADYVRRPRFAYRPDVVNYTRSRTWCAPSRWARDSSTTARS